jgi:hypothetical protein
MSGMLPLTVEFLHIINAMASLWQQLCCALPLRFHVTRNIFEEMIVRKFELERLSENALWGIHAGLTLLIVG